MDFVSAQGRERYAAVVAAAVDAFVGLDFDGTLAPIVTDPAAAWIHPGAGAALVRLAALVRGVAIVTGRPAGQAVRLGHLDDVADAVEAAGGELWVLGQYGAESWSSTDREVHSPEPPAGLSRLRDRLPALLAQAGAADAFVEEKGLAVGVHTRRMHDPDAAYQRLLPVLTVAARDAGLHVEPGRRIIELRPAGTDKGTTVRAAVERLGARAVVFAGDDLGDVAAFDAVEQLRADGVPGLLVCVASEEQPALRERADVLVEGPADTVAFLTRLADDAGRG